MQVQRRNPQDDLVAAPLQRYRTAGVERVGVQDLRSVWLGEEHRQTAYFAQSVGLDFERHLEWTFGTWVPRSTPSVAICHGREAGCPGAGARCPCERNPCAGKRPRYSRQIPGDNGRGVAEGGDAALLQHHCMRAEAAHGIEVVADEDDGTSFPCHITHLAKAALLKRRIADSEHLVNEERSPVRGARRQRRPAAGTSRSNSA